MAIFQDKQSILSNNTGSETFNKFYDGLGYSLHFSFNLNFKVGRFILVLLNFSDIMEAFLMGINFIFPTEKRNYI